MARSYEELAAENEELHRSLDEAQELLRAIQSGEVDALVLSGSQGDQVYTLEGADRAYRILIEAMNDGAVTFIVDGTILYSNSRFAAMVKSSLEKVIGSSIYSFIPQADQSAFKVLLQGQGRGEITLRVGDESILPVYTSLNTLTLSEHQEAFCAVFTDLTEQKRSEEIVAAEKLARSIIEQANEAVVVCDDMGRIVRFSKVASDILGFDPTLHYFEDVFDLRHPTGERCSPISTALQGEVVLKLECSLKRKDGKVFHLLLNAGPLKSAEGKIIGLVVTLSDITKQKKMEEELKKARDELEQRVEERTSELALSKEELEVANEELQVELDHHIKLEVELSKAKEGQELVNEELQVELEQHRKLEVELIKAKESAEAAVEAKAAFMANMSHELRTPMNAIIGFSSLLMDDDLKPDHKEYIELIRNSGEVLLALINDILDFSRAEKEKMELEHQPLSLKRCIEESLDLVSVQAREKDLNLTYTISHGTPDTIVGDPGRLRQILINLLSNAVKFTDKGDISISILSKVIRDNKRQIIFAVRDTGIGIPQDKMNKLFLPFSQIEHIISRKRDGVGLGLAISKRLVELMGGEIWAESELGLGSTFYFTIQAETIPGKRLDLEMRDKDAISESISSQMPMSILVAEDNPSNQKVIAEMLKKLGYRPDVAANGVEVIKALELRPYDLVLMDIRMPEMDGLTAAREIRRLWPENGPKIIAVTAYAMEGDREMCLEAGMDDYIAKPILKNELKAVLAKYSVPSG